MSLKFTRIDGDSVLLTEDATSTPIEIRKDGVLFCTIREWSQGIDIQIEDDREIGLKLFCGAIVATIDGEPL